MEDDSARTLMRRKLGFFSVVHLFAVTLINTWSRLPQHLQDGFSVLQYRKAAVVNLQIMILPCTTPLLDGEPRAFELPSKDDVA